MSKFAGPIKAPMKGDHYIADYHKGYFPFIAQPKIDGFRCLFINGVALTSSMSPWRNRDLQEWARKHKDFLNGCDGELVAGNSITEENFRRSQRLNGEDYGPDWTFYAFNLCNPNLRTMPYEKRLKSLQGGYEAWRIMQPNDERLQIVPHKVVHNHEELLEYEAHWLAFGCEGVYLHHPSAPYKSGRSTAKEGWQLKVKQFIDFEGTIVGWHPLMRNQNEAFLDERGLQKRSVHQANLVEDTLVGSLDVVAGEHRFSVGSGMDVPMRDELYKLAQEGKLIGRKVTLKVPKSQGGYDSVRQPIFKGLRDPDDMSP